MYAIFSGRGGNFIIAGYDDKDTSGDCADDLNSGYQYDTGGEKGETALVLTPLFLCVGGRMMSVWQCLRFCMKNYRFVCD
jgi:hypothetical protein